MRAERSNKSSARARAVGPVPKLGLEGTALAPALRAATISPRERGNRPPRLRQSRAPRLVAARDPVFPLPAGEGQGEGEGGLRLSGTRRIAWRGALFPFAHRSAVIRQRARGARL